MTQTQTRPPDPDGNRPDPDPGPDDVRTQTLTATQTSDPDPGPRVRTSDPGPQTQTPDLGPRTPDPGPQTPDPTETTADLDTKIRSGSGVRGPDTAQTQTPAETRTIRAQLRRDYPGGFFARLRASRDAKRLAYDEAVLRGAEAELLLMEAEALGEIEPEAAAAPPAARWERFVAGWPQTLLTIAVAILAARGQVDFAIEQGAVGLIKIGSLDLTPWFAPAVLDLSVAALFGRGMYVAVKNHDSPWLAWGAGLLVGAFSVYTNTQHDKGALVYAAASAVGLLSWMVALIYKYLGLPHVKAARAKRKKDRADRRATSNPRLVMSSLLLASRKTATRGWTIARRRPLALAAERLSEQQGQQITVRDLTIRAAELFNNVLADRQIAELEKIGDPPPETDKAARKAWEARRDQAMARAEMVAWDAVDNLLGIPVIQREGIQVNPITYREPIEQPQLVRRLPPADATAAAPAAPALPTNQTLALTDATAAAPAAPALTASQTPPGPRPTAQRRLPAPALPGGTAEQGVVVAGPGGNGAENYLPLGQIEGLGHLRLRIDPTAMCKCHSKDPTRYCGKTLVFHIERRGRYIAQIIDDIDEWGTRPERIGNGEIKDIVGGNSKGLWMELSWVMDQLRRIAQEDQAERDAEATVAAVVLDQQTQDPEAPAQ